MKTCFYLLLISISLLNIQAQENNTKQYNFEIYDGANLSTMHAFNNNYLTSYRIFQEH